MWIVPKDLVDFCIELKGGQAIAVLANADNDFIGTYFSHESVPLAVFAGPLLNEAVGFDSSDDAASEALALVADSTALPTVLVVPCLEGGDS